MITADYDADGEQNAKEVLEFGELFEPPFYGTGDMLVWDRAAVGTELVERCGDQAIRPVLESMVGSELWQPRGSYAFFPVIAEKDHLVLLDPGDFCSELAVLQFSRPGRQRQLTLAQLFRPEGDIAAFAVATSGVGLACPPDGDKLLWGRAEEFVSGHVGAKVVREIRRALYLDDSAGKFFPAGHPATFRIEVLPKLFELLAVEERLGVSLDSEMRLSPAAAHFSLFVHHPKAAVIQPT